MRVGIVCPYSLDVAGGVQAHVLDLARALIGLGHDVDVFAPASDGTEVPPFVTRAGRAVAIPYNGSVARLTFGPVSYARVRRWLREGDFDVLHLHEPTAPSLSMLALLAAEGPVVATFHTSTARSRTMLFFQPVLRPLLEKVTARIAVSPLARRVYVEHLGGDAVEIPNGVDVGTFASARPREGYPTGATVGFVGRYTEPRKGMPLLLDALRPLVDERPDLRLLVVGRGDPAELERLAGPALAARITCLGAVDEATKARVLASVDLFAAPNTGGESFGVVVAEALAAGAPVVASDLEAFRRVVADPAGGAPAGRLVARGDAAAWTATIQELLGDPSARARLREAGRRRVLAFDWSVVASEVLRVYEVAVESAPGPTVATVNLVGPGSGTAIAIVVVVLVLAAITAAILVIRARRLDRLHVRTDAAAAALIAALDRRASVVRAVAATAGPVALADPDRRALRGAAQAAEVAGAGEAREAAENDLAHRLRPLDTAALPADLAAELADAHARVAVARHVHNDAVRDTRALRSRRMVRWLKLAGTAPVPRYFEIAEPEATAGPAPAPARDAVRVVVLDAAGRTLLLRGVDPARPAESFWFTPGGGVGAGEDVAVAAARELTAGTGLVVPPEDLAGPLWTRAVVFVVDGITYAGRELYLLARLEQDEPEIEPTSRATDEGVDEILERRWWTATELAATVDVVHPHQLAELLAEPASLEAGATPVAIH